MRCSSDGRRSGPASTDSDSDGDFLRREVIDPTVAQRARAAAFIQPPLGSLRQR